MSRKLIAALAAVGALAASVSAFAARDAGAADAPSPSGGAALIQRACIGCHAMEVVMGKGHSAQEWSDIIDRMSDRGVDATDAELAQIKAYLIRTLPPGSGQAAQ